LPIVTLPDGVRMYYETEGAGEPLLLLMGMAGDHYGWGPIPANFAARWQVIVFDYRGTGQMDFWPATRSRLDGPPRRAIRA
jgi:3-oxoadipate enol-lactonase